MVIAAVTLLTFLCLNVKAEEKNQTDDEQIGYVVLSSYSSRLNVREGASTKFEVLGKLAAGDIVHIVGEDENFYEIKFNLDSNPITAFVSKDYVVIPDKDTEEYELVSAAVITSKTSSENRNYNMALACEKINGLVLKPGEQFDWYGENGVGQASKANGFKQATVIQGRRYVKGYGGGVCQVSTALYNCIFDLDIEPDELHHHSLRSAYVEKGMDATVAYPSKNFIFTNSKDYTLEFEAFTDEGQVTILAYKKLSE